MNEKAPKIQEGWYTPEGEIIPRDPNKSHLGTMLKYADEHGIPYDNDLSRFMLLIYFNKLGYTWFDKTDIQIREYHTEQDIRKIKDYIGIEEINISIMTPEKIAYYERTEEKRR